MVCQKKLWTNFRKSKINKLKRDAENSASLFDLEGKTHKLK
jgi:hypothetical protein